MCPSLTLFNCWRLLLYHLLFICISIICASQQKGEHKLRRRGEKCTYELYGRKEGRKKNSFHRLALGSHFHFYCLPGENSTKTSYAEASHRLASCELRAVVLSAFIITHSLTHLTHVALFICVSPIALVNCLLHVTM